MQRRTRIDSVLYAEELGLGRIEKLTAVVRLGSGEIFESLSAARPDAWHVQRNRPPPHRRGNEDDCSGVGIGWIPYPVTSKSLEASRT